MLNYSLDSAIYLLDCCDCFLRLAYLFSNKYYYEKMIYLMNLFNNDCSDLNFVNLSIFYLECIPLYEVMLNEIS